MSLTPSQTIGPFFGYALPYDDGPRLVPEHAPGAVRLRGRVLDGAAVPVPDALVEIRQADAAGRPAYGPGALRRAGHDFVGYGRCGTDAAGEYWFHTVEPGAVGAAAPYIAMLVFARGLLRPVATRVYFPEEEAANAADPVLSAVPAERRATLLAAPDGDGHRFDIRLQGAEETVFFAL